MSNGEILKSIIKTKGDDEYSTGDMFRAMDLAYNKGIDDAIVVVTKAFMPVGEINGQLLEYIISELEVFKKKP